VEVLGGECAQILYLVPTFLNHSEQMCHDLNMSSVVSPEMVHIQMGNVFPWKYKN
jgi:hypothetical protein